MEKEKVTRIIWKTIYNILEVLVIGVGILTFNGKDYIGFNLPKQIFLVLLAVVLIHPIYKLVLRLFNVIDEIRKENDENDKE